MVLGTDVRYSDNTSRTRDLSWNLIWQMSDRWSMTADVQLIMAKAEGVDNTIGLRADTLPKERVDLSGSVPQLSFDQVDHDFLADLLNYF